MGLRYAVQSLLARLTGSNHAARSRESDPDRAGDESVRPGETIQSVELPGGADWEQAAALVVAERGVHHECPLPNDVADPTSPLTIQFGGSSTEPNTVIWPDPPEVTAGAEILIQDPEGEVRPIPRTERRGG